MKTLKDFCDVLKKQLPEITSSASPLVAVESLLALDELQTLINVYGNSEEELNNQNLEPFKTFLANRWERIRGTDAAYPHNPHDPLNQACFWLAIANQNEQTTAYELLMPGIEAVNQFSMEDINDLALHHFILADDEIHWINIADCLDYAGAETADGILKHIGRVDNNNQRIVLSATEKARLLQHSPQTEKYYAAITDAAAIRQDKFHGAAGPHIEQLINGLRLGGAHGKKDGTELNSGNNANEAIVEFSQFLAQLDEKAKAELFALAAPGFSDSLGNLWGRLARPTDADYSRTTYCVELVANGLEGILKHHRDMLYGDLLKKAEEKLQTEKQSWAEELKEFGDDKKHHQVQSTYGDQGKATLLNKISQHPAATRALETAAQTCIKHWATMRSSTQMLSEQIELLALLEKIPTGNLEQKELLFKQITGSWRSALNTYQTEKEKGKLLYRLLTHPHAGLAQHMRYKGLIQRAGKWINDAAVEIAKTDKITAHHYLQEAANLGEHTAMYNLGYSFQYHQTPPNLTEATAWYAKSYSLWKDNKDRNEVIQQLKIISLQTTDPVASQAAIIALETIYISRWSGAQPLKDFSERLDFLALLEKIPTDNLVRKELLFKRITDSWEKALNTYKTEKEKGKLLYRLLTHPHAGLAQHIRTALEDKKLIQKAGDWINDAAVEIGGTDKITAHHYLKEAASFGGHTAMYNLGYSFQYYQTPPNLTEATAWYAKSYSLWNNNKDRDEVIKQLKKISLQTTDLAASEAAKKALDEINFLHLKVIKAIQNAIIVLPIPDNNSSQEMKIIILPDGIEKKVPADIATQWRMVNDLLKETNWSQEAVEKIIRVTRGKTTPINEFKEYYAMFNSSNCLDTIIKESAKQQLNASYWQDQPNGILKILAKATEQKDEKEIEKLTVAMQHWVNKFGNADTFLKIDKAYQEQLSYRIIEGCTPTESGATNPIAILLQAKLKAQWEKNKNIPSKIALLNLYTKQRAYSPSPKEKKPIEESLTELSAELHPNNLGWREKREAKKYTYQLFTSNLKNSTPQIVPTEQNSKKKAA
jgi:hypothetical protein